MFVTQNIYQMNTYVGIVSFSLQNRLPNADFLSRMGGWNYPVHVVPLPVYVICNRILKQEFQQNKNLRVTLNLSEFRSHLIFIRRSESAYLYCGM
jgi:hypothetical protein